jgi:hypothetical protein
VLLVRFGLDSRGGVVGLRKHLPPHQTEVQRDFEGSLPYTLRITGEDRMAVLVDGLWKRADKDPRVALWRRIAVALVSSRPLKFFNLHMMLGIDFRVVQGDCLGLTYRV